jgi:histidinol phosphatase-like enzyme
MLDEAGLLRIHERLTHLLQSEGVALDGWYWCPHVSDSGCECRKPEAGMLLRAQRELGIDLGRSWMVGDKLSDLEAGRRVGARTVLVATGYGREHYDLPQREQLVDFFVPTLLEAAEVILAGEKPADD